ncbi:uncharacterized protein LOC143245003 isoform X2 [Tachypleus tridentatus]|uniref:uncharacterized protein LOC143245003 isoform X2 n=1 Tax=Tachypleus tridentatus TaxID=6853 RepID=UPI003FD39B3E
MWETMSDFPVEQISIVVLLSVLLSYFTWCIVRFGLHELRRTIQWHDVSLRVMTAHGQSDSYYCESTYDDKLFSWHHHEDCDDEFIHSAVELGKQDEEDLTPEERHLILLYANNNNPDVPCLPDFDYGISRCLDTIEEENLEDLHSLSDGGSFEWRSWESQSTGSGDDCVTVVEVSLGGRRKQEISASPVLEAKSVTVFQTSDTHSVEEDFEYSSGIHDPDELRVNEASSSQVTAFETSDTRTFGEGFEYSREIHDPDELRVNEASSSQANVSDYKDKLSIEGNDCTTRNEVDTRGDVSECRVDKVQRSTRLIKQEASNKSSTKVLKFPTQTVDVSETGQLLNVEDKDGDWFELDTDKTTDSYHDGIDTPIPNVLSLSDNYSRCKVESFNSWQRQTTYGWDLEHFSTEGEERRDFINLPILPNTSTIHGKHTHLPCVSKSEMTLRQNNVISLQPTETSSENSPNNQTQSSSSSSSSNLNAFNEKYEGNMFTRSDKFPPYRDSVKRLPERGDYGDNPSNVIRSTQMKTSLYLNDFDENVLAHNYSSILSRTNGELCPEIETCLGSEKSTFSESDHAEEGVTWEDNRGKTPNKGFSSRHDEDYSSKGSTLHDHNVAKEYNPRLTEFGNNDLGVRTLALPICDNNHTSDMDPVSNQSDQVSKQSDFCRQILLETDRTKNYDQNTTNQEAQYLSNLVDAQSFTCTLKFIEEIGTKYVPMKHDYKKIIPDRETGDTDDFQTEDVGCKKNRKYVTLSASGRAENRNTRDDLYQSNVSICMTKNHQKVHKNEHCLSTEVKQNKNFEKYETNTFWPQKIVKTGELISSNCCKNSKETLGLMQRELSGEILQKNSCHDDRSNSTNHVLLTDTEEHAPVTVYLSNRMGTTRQKGNVEQDAPSSVIELHSNNVDLYEQAHSPIRLTLESINATENRLEKPDYLNIAPGVSVLSVLNEIKCEENKKIDTKDENKTIYLKEDESCMLTENLHTVSDDQVIVDHTMVERYSEFRCKEEDGSSENKEKPGSSSDIMNTQNAFREEGLESSNMKLTLKNDSKHTEKYCDKYCSYAKMFIGDHVNLDHDLITKTDSITGGQTFSLSNRKKRIQKLLERDNKRKARMCNLSSQETTSEQFFFPAHNCQTTTNFDGSFNCRNENNLHSTNTVGNFKSSLFLPTDKISERINTKPKFDVTVAPSVDNLYNNILPHYEKQECTSTIILGERQSPEGSAAVPEQEEPVRLFRQNLREYVVPVSSLDIIYSSDAIFNENKNENKQLSKHSISSHKTDNFTEDKHHNINQQIEIKDEKMECQTYQDIFGQKDIKKSAVIPINDICYNNSFSQHTNLCNPVDNEIQQHDLKKPETNDVKIMTGKYFNFTSEAKQPLKENYELNNSSDNDIITLANDKSSQGVMKTKIHSKNYSLIASKTLFPTTLNTLEKKQNFLSTHCNTKEDIVNPCITFDYATYYTATAKPKANNAHNTKTGMGRSTPNISTVDLSATFMPGKESDNYQSESSVFRRELTLDEGKLVRRRRTRSSPDLRQFGNATQRLDSAPISALLSKPVSERIQSYLEQQTKSKGFIVPPGEKLSRLRRQCNSIESVKEKAARFEAKKVLPNECQVSCALKQSRREVEANGIVNKVKLQKSTVLQKPSAKALTPQKYRIFSAPNRKESQTSCSEVISLNEREVSQIPARAESDSLAIATSRDNSLFKLIDGPVYPNSDSIQNVGSAQGITSEYDVDNMVLSDNKYNNKGTSSYIASNANSNELINQRGEVSCDNEHGSVTHSTNVYKTKTGEINLTVSGVEEAKNTKISEPGGFNTLSPIESYQSSKLSISVNNNVMSLEDTLERDPSPTKVSVKETEDNKNLAGTQERSFASAQLHRGVKSRILNARKQFFNEVKNSETYQFDKEKVGALERLESFRRGIHAERTKLLLSTPDLAASVEAAVKSFRRTDNGLYNGGRRENEEYGRTSFQVKSYQICNEDIVWPSCVKTASREASVRERSKSLGYLETNVDTLESHEVLETNIDNMNNFPQQDSLLSRTRSMAILPEDSLAQHHSTILDASRARSMDYLLDEENRQAILPPENTLYSSKTRSEHELIIERSLRKLNLPDWCKGTAKEGFILRRGEGRRPTWQRLNSRTPSSTSLTSSSMLGRNVVIPKRVTLPDWRYVESLKSSRESLAVTTLGSVSTQEHYPLSRWSSSRLSTYSAPPHSTWTGYRSIKKPYLGWRATMMNPSSSDTIFASASHSDRDLAVKHDNSPLNNDRDSPVEFSSSSHLYSSDMQRRWNSVCPSDLQGNLTVHRPRKYASPQDYCKFESCSDNEADTESIISHVDKLYSTFQSSSNTTTNPSKKSTHSQYSMIGKHSASRSPNRNTSDCARSERSDSSFGVAEDFSKKSFLGIRGFEEVIHKNNISKDRYPHVPKNSENQLTIDINDKITSKLTPRDKEPKMSNDQQVIWMESSFVGRRPTTSMVVLPSTLGTSCEDDETRKQHPITDNSNSYPNHAFCFYCFCLKMFFGLSTTAPLTETSSLSTQVQTRRVQSVAALYD